MITKRRYIEFEILKAEKEGYEVYQEGRGSISLDCRSSLFCALRACEKAFPSADIIHVIGGGSKGPIQRDWAVMYRPRNEAPGKANGLCVANGVVSETLQEESYHYKRAAAASSGCVDDERGL